MKVQRRILRMLRPFSNAKMFGDYCSGLFFNEIRQRALLLAIFALAIAVASGCTSTGGDVRAGLIAPVTGADRSSNGSHYQAPRSPGFNDISGS